MSSFGRQVKQAAESTGRAIGAVVGFFFRIRAVIRALEDAVAWYREFTGQPQSKKSLLLTYALGALVVVLTPLLAIITVPLLFGYLVREVGMMLHTENDRTLLHDPWRADRPAFRNVFDLTVDGLKIAVLPVGYVLTVAFVWYNATGLLDAVTDDLAGAAAIALVPTALVGFVGWLVFPAFLVRYADHGRLGPAVADPGRFTKDVILSPRYLAQFALGTGAVLLVVVISVGIYLWLSPLLVVSIGLPLAFLATLQAFDHFAIGYKRAVGTHVVETDETTELGEDKYLVPFREGEVSTPDRDRSILALGETGSGKTEAIKLLAYQFQSDPEDPFVVFDYKEDYHDFFANRVAADGGVEAVDDPTDLPGPDLDTDDPDDPDDLIVLSLDDSTHHWNIFAEADLDAEDDKKAEADFEELGRTLFAGQEADAGDPFFAVAARQAFVGVLKVIYRDENIENPTNEDLVAYFEESDLDEIYADLRAHDDLKGIAMNLDPETNRRMAGAVYGQIQVVISEVFRGDFRKPGDFSIREYMEDPRGHTLLLDFPADRGETIKPIFRLMIDWAIRFGLADPDRSAYYVLDEFATIPGLERLERLVNVGRARKAYGILGVQAKSQLHSTYGKDEAESILSGLAQEVLLRPGDKASVDHIRARLGRNQRIQLQQGPTDRITRLLTDRESEYNQYTINEDFPMSEAELQQFQAGEAVVIEPEGWRRGRLFMLDEIRDRLDRVRAGDLDPIEVPVHADRPDRDGA